MSEFFKNADGMIIVENLIVCIKANVEYLSQVDGAIADGDHGINMQKGFTITERRMQGQNLNLTDSMNLLGDVLVSDIGGSMGPIYGSYFIELGDGCRGTENVDKHTYLKMYRTALDAVLSLGKAKLGDKTMLDTLIPAVNSLEKAVSEDRSFKECLELMSAAAADGMNATKDMVAKIGRASRLGERSRGVLDAGAVSCQLIIVDMTKSVLALIA